MNEPGTSLHPDLLPPLARLISRAAERSQVFVVSHASRLIAALEKQPDCHSIMLEKQFGATLIRGVDELDLPPRHWTSRYQVACETFFLSIRKTHLSAK